ncbi:polysaccharide biosynthesis protein [Cedecea neteri]|uniref:Putative O-antigen transporter n=1 Tax=Cedecea neteri TaxID=158822 RepID=A0AAN0VV94_9ENTR|nr:polysaccharide biosynthesis protein [Cedecea neteri]AIR62967.1 polysaccharide biosynthesis protein [Cedecea neteri]
MSGFKRLIKNSISNIINGFSNVILGVIISPVLLHNLSKVDFSIWSLTLQVGILFGVLGLGIQVTVGRFISLYLNEPLKQQKVMYQSLIFTLLLGILCFSVILILAQFFFTIFPEVKSTTANAELIFILIGGSFVINNITAPFIGYFTGIERNDITARVNVIFKIILGCVVFMSVDHGLDIIAWGYFIVNGLNQFAFFILYRTQHNKGKINFSYDKKLLKKIIVFFSGLLVWNIAQFFISGIGTFTVGKLSFAELPGFAVLMTLVNAGVGILGAMINPIIQPMLRMNNSGKRQHVELFVDKITLLFAMLVFVGVFIAWFISIHILGVWLGYEQAEKLHILFSLLLASYLIRMVAAPYGLMLVSYGKQLSISYFPVIEGVLNFALSLFFVRHYGAIGIAYSTFISGMLIMFVYALKYRTERETKSNSIFISYLLIPLMIIVCLISLVMTESMVVHRIIYSMQLVCALGFVALIVKQAKSIKTLLNEY